MDISLNKPRVFLSHSKVDEKFINRVCSDFKKCQIQPWLDTEEIRHGKPWLDAIFEHGIPTCDCVLVYFTENSLNSAMVKKEIDAGILSQLKESHIAFLAYVDAEEIRQRLRPDIQALQVPIWNSKNYHSLLPQVVAEVWRSFLERTVSNALSAERVRRLESELQMEKLKRSAEGGIFTSSENRDFEYIWKRLDRFELVTFQEQQRSEKSKWLDITTHSFSVNIGTVVPLISRPSTSEYTNYVLENLLEHFFTTHIIKTERQEGDTIRFVLVSYPKILDELLMYGFVAREHVPEDQRMKIGGISFGPQYRFVFVYSEKIDRFKYWLAVNGKLPKEILWKTDIEKAETH